jgi:TolB-like protein/DNA-binding winged helix-turn-helix (wHTH) protein
VDRPTAPQLKIGDWFVSPAAAQISRRGEAVRLEGRMMRLLLCLAGRPGEVVSVEQLLDEVWSGVVVTPDSVYQAVTSLRRLLRDDARQPTYIETLPRLGYRLVAPVSPWADGTRDPGENALLAAGKRVFGRTPRVATTGLIVAGGASIVLLAALAWGLHSTQATSPGAPAQRSVAVLPFLDLTTQEMNEEYFADGMTEELVNKLSKVPGLKVPAPTASFYYKNKKVPMATIGQALGVRYLLDGSIRKSGSLLRISARLVRTADGYVVWSGTYDTPAGDKVKTQDEIATAVSRSLSSAIN